MLIEMQDHHFDKRSRVDDKSGSEVFKHLIDCSVESLEVLA